MLCIEFPFSESQVDLISYIKAHTEYFFNSILGQKDASIICYSWFYQTRFYLHSGKLYENKYINTINTVNYTIFIM